MRDGVLGKQYYGEAPVQMKADSNPTIEIEIVSRIIRASIIQHIIIVINAV